MPLERVILVCLIKLCLCLLNCAQEGHSPLHGTKATGKKHQKVKKKFIHAAITRLRFVAPLGCVCTQCTLAGTAFSFSCTLSSSPSFFSDTQTLTPRSPHIHAYTPPIISFTLLFFFWMDSPKQIELYTCDPSPPPSSLSPLLHTNTLKFYPSWSSFTTTRPKHPITSSDGSEPTSATSLAAEVIPPRFTGLVQDDNDAALHAVDPVEVLS